MKTSINPEAAPQSVRGFHFCHAALLALALLFGALLPATAQVLVYRVVFEREGTSVNYPRPLMAYLVADAGGTSFTSVAVFLGAPGERHYYANPFVTGSRFRVTGRFNRTFDVFSGGNDGGVSDNLAMQVTGSTSGGVGIGGGDSLRLARRVQGGLFLAGADSFTNEDNGNTVGQFEPGFFGFAVARGRFERGFTRRFNNAGLDQAGAIAELVAMLEGKGIRPLESNSQAVDPLP